MSLKIYNAFTSRMPFVVTSSSFTPAPTAPPSSEIMSCTCYLHHATEPDPPPRFPSLILCAQVESTVRGTHILSPVARPLYARRSPHNRWSCVCICIHMYTHTVPRRCPRDERDQHSSVYKVHAPRHITQLSRCVNLVSSHSAPLRPT